MNASWILITFAIVHFSKSESNWFTKGTVKTVTYNENGEQVTYEREMTDEERISLQKTINQAKDEIAGIGEKVNNAIFRGTNHFGGVKSHIKTSADQMRRSFEDGADRMRAAGDNLKRNFNLGGNV